MPLASPDDIVASLRDYGCKVHEWAGWRTRGRPYRFAPYGQAWHHDAFYESYGDLEAAGFMVKGRSDLPGPIANGAIGNYGTVFLVAYGNANHAGRNRASVLKRLQAGLAPLGWARDQPYEADTVVGNTYLWGWECRNAGTGRDPWDQLDVMVRAGAAMADACGWNANQNAGHGELTTRKIDPVGFQLDNFRLSIALRQLAHHHKPTPQEEEDMDNAIIALYNIARGTASKPYDVRMQEPKGFLHWQTVGARYAKDDPINGWRKAFNGLLIPGLRKERPNRDIPNIPLV